MHIFISEDKSSCLLSGPEPKPVLSGNGRTYRVWMDTNQYQRDMARVVKGEEVSRDSSMYITYECL